MYKIKTPNLNLQKSLTEVFRFYFIECRIVKGSDIRLVEVLLGHSSINTPMENVPNL